jgi:hypothetical protein
MKITLQAILIAILIADTRDTNSTDTHSVERLRASRMAG